MLFNSLDFLLFFLLLYGVYLSVGDKYKNSLLLLGSYFFYGSWNWKFLTLLGASTIVDFYCGKKIYNAKLNSTKKKALYFSIFFNLSLLAVFKYFNFFIQSFSDLISFFGVSPDITLLNVVLPVGISFYTFQTMSYTIDIYRGQLKPVNNLLDFALFVSFFPQLVAGPIERAVHLIPQIVNKPKINKELIKEGLYLILMGYYKKVYIADRCAPITDYYFNNSIDNLTAGNAITAILAFTFQIYGDFSGYSDIARGVSKLLGYDLMINFKMPYFSQNPSEFWRRWHISLSSWLRDYLYISLGGNRHGTFITYRNLFLTMLLGGLWHGAAWNFVLWGTYQGLLLVVHRLFSQNLKVQLPKIFNILLMFIFTCYGWLLFRANSFEQIENFTYALLNFQISSIDINHILQLIFLNSFLIFIQYKKYQFNNMNYILTLSLYKKLLVFFTMISSIILLGKYSGSEFIYFQF